MCDILQKIAQADAATLEMLLDAVIQRHAVLYPDWDLHIVSLCKSIDENEQIDRAIAFLESLRPGI